MVLVIDWKLKVKINRKKLGDWKDTNAGDNNAEIDNEVRKFVTMLLV